LTFSASFHPHIFANISAAFRPSRLNEPGFIAVSWHQIGIVYERAKQPEAAEDAYRKSLEITVRLRDIAGQARTLNQLGNFYVKVPGRLEEGAAFYRLATDKYGEMQDAANEGRVRNNLANTLRALGRFDEARKEIFRAVECGAQFGLGSQPWTCWAILED
jgi:tetratricopeptide (TPR) repeat protein